MSAERSIRTKQESQSPEVVERATSRPVYRPPVDILDTPEAVVLVADMPGVDETNADVILEKNVLTLRGTVALPNVEGYTLAYAEYGIGDFERSFTISNEVDREGIEATVRDGVLRVTLPKSKQAVSRKISVTAG